MKKIVCLLFSVTVSIVSLEACTNRHQHAPQNSIDAPSITQNNELYSKEWRQYKNDSLAIRFEYPTSWQKREEDLNVVNLKRERISTEISFIDTISNTKFVLTYNFSAQSISLYTYAFSKLSTSTAAMEILIDGVNAVKSESVFEKDGKGNKLANPIQTILIDLLDKNQTGEIQIQLQTLENDSLQLANLEHLIASFRFSNKTKQ